MGYKCEYCDSEKIEIRLEHVDLQKNQYEIWTQCPECSNGDSYTLDLPEGFYIMPDDVAIYHLCDDEGEYESLEEESLENAIGVFQDSGYEGEFKIWWVKDKTYEVKVVL